MSADFSHARAATAATRTTSSAQQSLLRLSGNSDEVSTAATPTLAADQVIAPSTNAAVPPVGNTNRHASQITAAVSIVHADGGGGVLVGVEGAALGASHQRVASGGVELSSEDFSKLTRRQRKRRMQWRKRK
mmetsp:Transcript_66558/g.124482  ORF Transcript_66558/g.124482 Transcript_66558/m.124482 type:complete len:132 (-) Transcript_66558:188-583(-)